MDAYLDRDQARIAYRIEGDREAPPVVVAHSFLASRRLEDTVGVFEWVGALADRHALLRFDARGHGDSTGAADESHYRWPALSQDLLAVVDAAAPGEVVDGIGESTGCGTLLWAVVHAPQRFRRLVLVIPPSAREEREEQAKLYLAAADLIELRGQDAWLRLVDTFPPVPLLDQGGWARARSIPVEVALLPSILRGAAASDLPSVEELSAVEQPTLILAWTADPNHPVETAERLARELPNCTVEIASRPDEVRRWGSRVAAFLAAG